MMPPTIQVLVYQPGKEAGVVREILSTLEAMQGVVGGCIETVRFLTPLVLVCNEEGRLMNLPENRHGLCGTFFVVRVRGEKMVGLTGPEISAARKALEG
jgi:hypothetical protein